MSEEAGSGDEIRDLVLDVGKQLRRSAEDVEPFVDILMDNWFDTVDSLLDSTPEDLSKLKIPLRFAKELIAAAGGSSGGGSRERGGQEVREVHHREEWQESKGKGDGKGKKGKGKSKDKDKGKGKSKDEIIKDQGLEEEFQHIITLDTDSMDKAFPLRLRIIGDGAKNVKHIRNSTNAHMWLRGKGSGYIEQDGRESPEPLYLQLTCKDKKSLDKAAEMGNDLIDTVFDEYAKWQERGGGGRDDDRRGKGKKGKSKGKGKDKDRRDSYYNDEPPSKRARY